MEYKEEMNQPEYLLWLIEEKNVVLDNGEHINCYYLDYKDDESV